MVSISLALPLLYIAMVPMISWLPFKVPGFMDMMRYPFVYAFVELLLTIPILIAGYRFYTVGFKALVMGSPNMDSLIAIGTSAAVGYSMYNMVGIWNGDYSAVDGVVEGSTSIDESMLTGESMPVDKKVSNPVYVASINKNGMIYIKATKSWR